jgi:hypothetical protein
MNNFGGALFFQWRREERNDASLCYTLYPNYKAAQVIYARSLLKGNLIVQKKEKKTVNKRGLAMIHSRAKNSWLHRPALGSLPANTNKDLIILSFCIFFS